MVFILDSGYLTTYSTYSYYLHLLIFFKTTFLIFTSVKSSHHCFQSANLRHVSEHVVMTMFDPKCSRRDALELNRKMCRKSCARAEPRPRPSIRTSLNMIPPSRSRTAEPQEPVFWYAGTIDLYSAVTFFSFLLFVKQLVLLIIPTN